MTEGMTEQMQEVELSILKDRLVKNFIHTLEDHRFDCLEELPISSSGDSLDWANSTFIPSFPGIYIFWWNSTKDDFLEKIQTNQMYFKGPNGSEITYTITFDKLRDFQIYGERKLPLYVGKSTDIKNRIGKHLLLGSSRSLEAGSHIDAPRKATTSCQLRHGIDRLFPELEDTRMIITDNVEVSYLEVEDFSERFFLEDKEIGLLRPIFNLDSER